jgi:putative cardiolipin synthase
MVFNSLKLLKPIVREFCLKPITTGTHLIKIKYKTRLLAVYILILLSTSLVAGEAATQQLSINDFRQEASKHPEQTAAYVLEQSQQALLARAWLADRAQKSIEVQYFIWSSDNIGILATEALLRAAERGVKVRVIVDDLLIDAPDQVLLALALHPNVDIRIYNPQHSVGTPAYTRVLNMLIDFRGFNQRMHDKVFIVDGDIAITGGRNMADEYFDYDQAYNFRDRDVLLLGAAPKDILSSFNRFWNHKLSVPVEQLYDGFGILQKRVTVSDEVVQNIYLELHAYASSTENFAPEVRLAIASIDDELPGLHDDMTWSEIQVINDPPGKNENRFSLGGGSRSAASLMAMLDGAQRSVTLQSPYLIPTKEAMTLFAELIERGVKIRINTNSLASTDNLQAFAGYRSQRKALIKMGVDIYEFRPDAAKQKALMSRHHDTEKRPLFALHAKTMVVDSASVYIGTFNLDPRSINLNTETGVIIYEPALAQQVEAEIESDMLPENSWSATSDPDSHSSWFKRSRARFWQLMPIKSLL